MKHMDMDTFMTPDQLVAEAARNAEIMLQTMRAPLSRQGLRNALIVSFANGAVYAGATVARAISTPREKLS